MSDLSRDRFTEIGKYSGYVSLSEFDYSVNISLKYKYVYVETPKVGCSSIKTILRRMELEDADSAQLEFDDIHNRAISPLLRPSQVGSFDRLLRNGFTTFCFVRNPFTRLLSAYLDKIQGNKPEKQYILLHRGENPTELNRELTFSDFVCAVCEQPIANMNSHWRLQYYLTYQRTMDYSFIGRFEHFEEDLQCILRRIDPGFMAYWASETRHATRTTELVDQYYSEELKEKVYLKYKEDFDHFGYNKNSYF